MFVWLAETGCFFTKFLVLGILFFLLFLFIFLYFFVFVSVVWCGYVVYYSCVSFFFFFFYTVFFWPQHLSGTACRVAVVRACSCCPPGLIGRILLLLLYYVWVLCHFLLLFLSTRTNSYGGFCDVVNVHLGERLDHVYCVNFIHHTHHALARMTPIGGACMVNIHTGS